MTDEQLRTALSKAWTLGQAYWRQADSDSYKQQDKSDVTRQSYLALVEETVAILQAASRDAPHPSIARAIAQEERACRAEDALIDLVNQIRKSNPVDDHGHDLKMNRAYLEAQKLLDGTRDSPSADAVDAQRLQRWKPKGAGGHTTMLSDNKGKYVKYADVLAMIADSSPKGDGND